MTDTVDKAIAVADKAVGALDPLGKALAVVIEKATAATEVGVNFLVAQIPDVLKQLLMWKMTESLLYFGFGLTLFILGIVGLVKVKAYWIKNKTEYAEKNKREWDSYDPMGEVMMAFGCALVGVAGFLVMSNHLTWIQILIAPKIYLIEYAAQIYRTMGK